MCANDPFLFGFGENVHHRLVARGPVSFGQAVHEDDIEMVRAQLLTEAVEIGAHFRSTTGPRLRENGYFGAVYVLESFGYMRMAAIRIGGVEKAQTVVVAIEQKARQTLHAKRGLVRMMARADRARTHSQTRSLDTGVAERNGVGPGEFAR